MVSVFYNKTIVIKVYIILTENVHHSLITASADKGVPSSVAHHM